MKPVLLLSDDIFVSPESNSLGDCLLGEVAGL